MIIERKPDGTTTWRFYKKQYRKARYRKWGARTISFFDKDTPGWYGLIIW